MKYKEYSLASLYNASLQLAEKLAPWQPDLVVFIARGGLPIGQAIATQCGCPMVGVRAEREGGRLKEHLTPILWRIPKRLRTHLRELELRSGVHRRHTARKVMFLQSLPLAERVLIVDDSIDTGASMRQVCAAVAKHLPQAELRTAALNVFSASDAVIHTDACLYYDTILSTPASADHAEHAAFLELWQAYETAVRQKVFHQESRK